MNSPLEVYLDALEKGLKPLPIHERLEQLDEARSHLEGLTEVFVQQGQTRAAAEEQAITQFGEVSTIISALNQATTKRRWLYTLGVAAIYGGIQQLCLIPVQFASAFMAGNLWSGSVSMGGSSVNAYIAFTFLGQLLACLTAGAFLRRLVPGNTLRPLLVSAALWVLFSVLVELQWRLQFQLALEYDLRIKLPTPPAPLLSPWAIAASFLTSGALTEARYALLRRRRILA